MSFSSTSVLVDGSFWSPFVWVVLLSATFVLTSCSLGVVWVLTRVRQLLLIRLALGACAAAMVVYVSPELFESMALALVSIGSSRKIYLCLLPTNLFLRDYAPGIIAVLAAAIAWRRRSSSQGVARLTLRSAP